MYNTINELTYILPAMSICWIVAEPTNTRYHMALMIAYLFVYDAFKSEGPWIAAGIAAQCIMCLIRYVLQSVPLKMIAYHKQRGTIGVAARVQSYKEVSTRYTKNWPIYAFIHLGISMSIAAWVGIVIPLMGG